MPELTMPSLGADMASGRLLEWHVAPGDRVARGDIVATVDTDKAEIEIETFHSGVIERLLVEPGTKVEVGGALATIGAAQDAAPPPPAPAAPEPGPAAPAPAPEPEPLTRTQPAAPPVAHHRRVSPLARRVAADLGVDLETVAGTGPGGAVTQADVERAAADRRPAASAEHRAPADRLASLNRAVGELMARSKREIPHYHLTRDIDLSTALDWLQTHNAARPAHERLLPAALLLRAVVLAAHDVPEVNGTYEDGAFRPSARIDLGVAVSLRAGGVIAPVIPAADALALADLMTALRALTGRARRGVLRGEDFAGGTLTVTSLGDQGADLVHGVIFPPQVALVGLGRIARRPWAEGDMVGSRRAVTATLAGDHRVSDGHRGSLFLASLDHHLQEPDQL